MRSWLFDKMADALNVKKMKVAELKKELALHGLETKGHKNELQERLKEFLQQQGLEMDHNEDAEDEDVEEDLENVTTGDDEEEISDDVLAEESLEQKQDITKVKLHDDTEKKAPVTVAENQNGADKIPVTKAVSTKTTIVKPTTEEERKLQRIKRFGGPVNEDDKKVARAQRFGTTSTAASASSPEAADLTKLKKRAERFGAVSPLVAKVVDQDRLLKRKERFGASLTTSDDSIEAKKKKRAERFST